MTDIAKVAITDSGRDLPILFFIHGWPDTSAVWKHQLEYFSAKYRCVCVKLPAFTPGDASTAVDFPELADRIAATVEDLKTTSSFPITIVGHDWGAYLTYLVDQRHPTLASKLVTLDIAASLKPESVGHALFLVSYQWLLIAFYGMGKVLPPVGNWLNRSLATFFRAPHPKTSESRSNYLYLYFWRARFLKKYRAALPRRYKPTKPLLFLYGMRKPYHFHSARWLEIVNTHPGCKVVAIQGGHWFQYKQPVPTNAAIDAWLGNKLQ